MTATLETGRRTPAGLVEPRAARRGSVGTPVTLLLRVGVPLALLAAWALGSAQGWIAPQTLPSPGAVWDAFTELVRTGVLWDNLSVSLQRALLGLAIGGTLGLVLGAFAGLSQVGDALVDPTMQMLRTIPFLAVAPLLIVWFGIGETSKIVLIAAAAAFPLYVNTHSGVRTVDRRLVEAARAYDLRGLRLVREVVLPQALPSILVGLRVSLSVSLIALIVAEQFNAPQGLGFLMSSAQQFFQTDVLVVCILVYAAWGLGADLLVRGLERGLMPWRGAGRAA